MDDMEKRIITPEIEDRLIRIGAKVKELRKSKGISYERMAYECNINRITYFSLEKGKNFQMRTLLLILRYHNITLEEFFKEIK